MSPSQFILKKSHNPNDSVPVGADVPALWKDGNPAFMPLMVGQKVLKKTVKKGNLLSSKLTPRYDGPYLIVNANQNQVTYTIEKLNSGEVKKVHYEQIKPYRKTPEYLRNNMGSSPLLDPPSASSTEDSDEDTIVGET